MKHILVVLGMLAFPEDQFAALYTILSAASIGMLAFAGNFVVRRMLLPADKGWQFSAEYIDAGSRPWL